MSNENMSTTEDSRSSMNQSASFPENNSFANAIMTEIKPEGPVSVANDNENCNKTPDSIESEDGKGKQDVIELEGVFISRSGNQPPNLILLC